MNTTFHQYIHNPMGYGTMIMSYRNMYKDLYTKKFDAILLRENGNIDYFLWKDKKHNVYYIHIKIPSEVVSNFYYDTVIQFTANIKNPSAVSLKEYLVKFYSNDPSFVYTFAYAFNKNKLFIDDLSSRINKISLTKRSAIKNPKDEIGYVKSLYFAFLVMDSKKLFNISYWNGANIYDKNTFIKNIVHADLKIADRIEKGKEIDKSNKIEKKRSRYHNDNKKVQNKTINNTKYTNTIKHFNKSKYIK